MNEILLIGSDCQKDTLRQTVLHNAIINQREGESIMQELVQQEVSNKKIKTGQLLHESIDKKQEPKRTLGSSTQSYLPQTEKLRHELYIRNKVNSMHPTWNRKQRKNEMRKQLREDNLCLKYIHKYYSDLSHEEQKAKFVEIKKDPILLAHLLGTK